jgi:UDP-N-acetyl-D-galactosamine dehydrogenase
MQRKIAVVGLGYVGLPVAVAFARAASAQAGAPEVVGFDIDTSRIGELRRGVDRTGEIEHVPRARIGVLGITTGWRWARCPPRPRWMRWWWPWRTVSSGP